MKITKQKSQLVIFMALIGCMLTVAACGTTTGGHSQFLLGIVSISPSEAGNAEFIAGAKQEAQAKGWQVSVIDANGSADQANAGMQNLVQRHAGAIIDMVFPATSLGAGLAAAKAANIPVATWGGGLSNGVIAEDGAGGPMATPIVQQMVNTMHGHGAVLALTYHAGQVCLEREQAFDAVLAKYPGVSVQKEEVSIPGQVQNGQQYAAAWLASHPANSGPLAIWGCWDDPALGAISTLKQEGRHDVSTYSENGGPAAITAVENGSLTATYWENSTLEGKTLVDTIQKASAQGSNWQSKTVVAPGEVVDASNIKQFMKQHPSATQS